MRSSSAATLPKAMTLLSISREIEEIIQKPIYFVLGNHDFYKDSIAKTRQRIAELAAESKHLRYLTAMEVVELSPQTAIIGHDGWADGRFGDYQGTEDHPERPSLDCRTCPVVQVLSTSIKSD